MTRIKKIILEEINKYISENVIRLNEWPDVLYYAGKKLVYKEQNTYAFASEEGRLLLSPKRRTHVSIDLPSGPASLYPNGRIWLDNEIISFWKYPESKDELYDIIDQLNKRLHQVGENKIIDDTWLVEIPESEQSLGGRFSKTHTSIFVPIKDYDLKYVNNPVSFKKELEKKYQQHIASPVSKIKKEIPYSLGSKKSIAGLSPSQYHSMIGVAENKQLKEWADSLWYKDKQLLHSDKDARTFGYKLQLNLNNFVIRLSDRGETHTTITYDQNKPSGRIWYNSKIISFWLYPKTKEELFNIMSDINESPDNDVLLDSSWQVEFPVGYDGKDWEKLMDRGRFSKKTKSVFVPVDKYNLYHVMNVSLSDLEKQKALHTMSPLKKPPMEIPAGLGSKKVHEPEWMFTMKEAKQKYKQLLSESVEHKIALEMIRDTIKDTEWQGKVFLAGGAVRDELMGKDVKDLDLTVSAPQGGIRFAEWLAKKLNIYKEESNPVIFPRFGTAKISLNGVDYQGTDLSKVDIETVMTRKEFYPDPSSRKPEVDFGTPEQDAERRDLTINSLMKDLSSGEIKDFTGKGLEDLKNKVIRTPIDPDIIFKEDPLRMLRAIRFTVRYGWKLPMDMIRSLNKNAPLLQNISAERIQDELNKILMTDRPHKGIRLLQILGLNKYIAPEFEKLVRMAQNDFHQWTADKHTYEVIKNTPPNLIARLSAFFHDIGKGETKTEKNGKIHFYGHEFKSADIARKVMTRLKYPTDVIDAVVVAVKNHMRTKSYGKQAELVSDKALRKLMNDLGDHLENALTVIHSDNISHGDNLAKWQHNLPDQVEYIRKRMKELGDFTGKLKIPIDGKDVISLIQKENPTFKPSKAVGDILDAIKDKFLENPKLTKSEAEKIVLDTYRKMPK